MPSSQIPQITKVIDDVSTTVTFRPREELSGEHPGGGRGDETVTDDLVGIVVRLMPDAAVVVDDQGRVVAANPLAETLFGYPSGELAGKSVDQLVPERLRSHHASHRANYIARPTQRPMGAGLELWAKRRDGTEFPVDISLAPLGVPERPLTLAAVRDLTQRRAEWAALGRLAAIVSASDDAIVSVDLRGTVTSWNQGAQRLLGYRTEEIVGRPIFRLVPASLRGAVEEQLARVRGGLRIPASDTRRVRKNGDEVDVSESLSLIRDPSGEPIGFAWLMGDITERKLAEEELRRLLTETQRRERWLEALSDIRLNLLGGGALSDWLDFIARSVCELVDADAATIRLTTGPGGGLAVVASVGESFAFDTEEELTGERPLLTRVVAAGETRATSQPDPTVVVPLATSQGTGGVLAAARSHGRPPFDREDVKMIESFAQQAGVVVEIAGAQGDRQQLALIADRERIARDLHDHVIQRLFAVGMALQAAAHSITDSRALERINDSVEELDATIRDVRSTIFSLELRATERAETSARAQILEIASKASAGLGFQPRLQFDGPVDTRVPPELVPDILAVVREGLSNVARHAGASSAKVQIDVHDDLVITVADDGRGLQNVERMSGLANMRARAESRGGSMEVGGVPNEGTVVRWRVPLPG